VPKPLNVEIDGVCLIALLVSERSAMFVIHLYRVFVTRNMIWEIDGSICNVKRQIYI
jgi:hypothetical protein